MKARKACALLGIDNDRLNEAIARGDCPFAPKTKAGSARVFSEDEFLALAIYAAMVSRGMSTQKAGVIASRSHAWIKSHDLLQYLTIVWLRGSKTKFFIKTCTLGAKAAKCCRQNIFSHEIFDLSYLQLMYRKNIGHQRNQPPLRWINFLCIRSSAEGGKRDLAPAGARAERATRRGASST